MNKTLNVDSYNLTDKEKKYLRIMLAKSGVLYISSPPGYAKSAILRNIAKKINAQYFDIRLSMVDETDVGLFPSLETIDIDGEKQKMLLHVAPKWAYESNKKLTIIHFEELNRSTLQVRNAALQILLEREIGTFFKFNDNVLMCASGNLGEEDGTDVEEFDEALNNRLIHIQHQLDINEWCENYANEFVCPQIINFLSSYTEYYWRRSDKNNKNKAYATPRSWTFLSDYIWVNYGNNEYEKRYTKNNEIILDENNKPKMFRKYPDVDIWLNDIKEIGYGYIGPAYIKFIKYCEDMLKISLDDVLNNFDNIKKDIEIFNRDKKSELLMSMRNRHIFDLNKIQKENLIKFLMLISKDECVAYLVHIVDEISDDDNEENEENLALIDFLSDKRFREYRDTIYSHVNIIN